MEPVYNEDIVHKLKEGIKHNIDKLKYKENTYLKKPELIELVLNEYDYDKEYYDSWLPKIYNELIEAITIGHTESQVIVRDAIVYMLSQIKQFHNIYCEDFSETIYYLLLFCNHEARLEKILNENSKLTYEEFDIKFQPFLTLYNNLKDNLMDEMENNFADNTVASYKIRICNEKLEILLVIKDSLYKIYDLFYRKDFFVKGEQTVVDTKTIIAVYDNVIDNNMDCIERLCSLMFEKKEKDPLIILINKINATDKTGRSLWPNEHIDYLWLIIEKLLRRIEQIYSSFYSIYLSDKLKDFFNEQLNDLHILYSEYLFVAKTIEDINITKEIDNDISIFLEKLKVKEHAIYSTIQNIIKMLEEAIKISEGELMK